MRTKFLKQNPLPEEIDLARFCNRALQQRYIQVHNKMHHIRKSTENNHTKRNLHLYQAKVALGIMSLCIGR